LTFLANSKNRSVAQLNKILSDQFCRACLVSCCPPRSGFLLESGGHAVSSSEELLLETSSAEDLQFLEQGKPVGAHHRREGSSRYASNSYGATSAHRFYSNSQRSLAYFALDAAWGGITSARGSCRSSDKKLTPQPLRHLPQYCIQLLRTFLDRRTEHIAERWPFKTSWSGK
jgi:hypothetical protein